MSNNRWSWDVPGFEPRKPPQDSDDHQRRTTASAGTAPPPLVRRYSISTSSVPPRSSELPKQALNSKLQRMKDKVKLIRDDYLDLKQEASDLQEYSNAKLDRVTRYLGVLAEKTRKLDQAALEAEARISPLISEKKRLFNDLLTAKGNIKVYCRARPLFEDEGSSMVEFPDEFTIRINTCDESLANPKKDFEFDRVYGPHVGQAEFFNDVQPFVQSAFDGYNVSIFAYGQTGSGKTHTMEGSNHDRGIYARCFEELFDLSNSDSTSTSQYTFSMTVSELYNEQIRDLLGENGNNSIDLVQEKVEHPMDFNRVLKVAFWNRGSDVSKFNVSHLIITINIYYTNSITGENLHSKLSLIDLAGSEITKVEDDGGTRSTDLLHVMKSLSALGDVLHALNSKKDEVPYGNSMLTKLLADHLGGSSKTLMILNICPNASNLSETLSSLNFSSRARSAMLSLGNRDTIVKWRDMANDERNKFYEKEKEIYDLKQEILELKLVIKHANDQCVLLFNEVQKAWKVSFTLQSDLKAENIMLAENFNIEKDQNAQLRIQMQQRDSTVQSLQAKVKTLESQLNEALASSEINSGALVVLNPPRDTRESENTESLSVIKRLEEELLKRDALIEKLHEENEKLFAKLTENASFAASPQVSSPSQRAIGYPPQELARNDNNTNARSMEVTSLSLTRDNNEGALVKSNLEKVKTTPAGDYLTSALNDFDPEQYEGLAAVSDGANKLLMLVLAAVIKAGASREHEILAEIRDSVFSFIRRMEPSRVMDTMLVSRVRILYIRSLLSRSPELQSIKVSPVDRFLEKAHSGHSRSSSPGRSPVRYESSPRNSLIEGQIQGFKIHIKPEKKSKLSSVVLKIRGIDQETWRQHVTGGKLREVTEEAKIFATGNKQLAALFVHTPAGELQRQIRNWLGDNFGFLISEDNTSSGPTGQLELLSTAIMDGWMAGLGAAIVPHTDALGLLLSEYAKRVYNSQLQHLKDIAGTLSTDVAEDLAQVAKLRSALESVNHKRTKFLQQMKGDAALLTLDGSSPIKTPSTAAEDARLASLVSLDGILKQVKDIIRQASVNSLVKSKKKLLLASLDELEDRMPSLLDIDHPCAKRQISEARQLVESVAEEEDVLQELSRPITDVGPAIETDVAQWNVLQFNTGSTTPFIIKCGANSNSELVIKADARVEEPKGGEIVRVVPRPNILENMNLNEMKQVFAQLPESMSLLALARTEDGTRARYSRLYRTLAMKVPVLRDLVTELEKGGALKDVRI